MRALLPPKEELTIFVRCSHSQLDLYRRLLGHHQEICEPARGEGEACKCKHLLSFHALCQKIVNHPDALLANWLNANAAVGKEAKEKKPASCEGDAHRCAALVSPPAACSQTPATIEQYKGNEACCEPSAQHDGGDLSCGSGSVQKELLKEMEYVNSETGPQDDVIMLDDDSNPADGVAGGGEALEDCIGEDDAADDEVPTADGVRNLGVAWADGIFGDKTYVKGDLNLSGKMAVLMQILKEARTLNHKTLVFSQYQTTLDCIQNFLKIHNTAARKQMFQNRTMSEIRYRRLDGSTAQKDRQSMVNGFNKSTSDHVFLISTKAGGLGLNLPAASRVVLVGLALVVCARCLTLSP